MYTFLFETVEINAAENMPEELETQLIRNEPEPQVTVLESEKHLIRAETEIHSTEVEVEEKLTQDNSILQQTQAESIPEHSQKYSIQPVINIKSEQELMPAQILQLKLEQPEEARTSQQVSEQPEETGTLQHVSEQPEEAAGTLQQVSEQPKEAGPLQQVSEPPIVVKTSQQVSEQPEEVKTTQQVGEQPEEVKTLEQVSEQPKEVRTLQQVSELPEEAGTSQQVCEVEHGQERIQIKPEPELVLSEEVVSKREIEVIEQQSPEVLEQQKSREVIVKQSLEVIEKQQSLGVIEQQSLEVIDQRSLEVIEQQSLEVIEQQSLEVIEQQSLEVIEQQSLEVIEQQSLEVPPKPRIESTAEEQQLEPTSLELTEEIQILKHGNGIIVEEYTNENICQPSNISKDILGSLAADQNCEQIVEEKCEEVAELSKIEEISSEDKIDVCLEPITCVEKTILPSLVMGEPVEEFKGEEYQEQTDTPPEEKTTEELIAACLVSESEIEKNRAVYLAAANLLNKLQEEQFEELSESQKLEESLAETLVEKNREIVQEIEKAVPISFSRDALTEELNCETAEESKLVEELEQLSIEEVMGESYEKVQSLLVPKQATEDVEKFPQLGEVEEIATDEPKQETIVEGVTDNVSIQANQLSKLLTALLAVEQLKVSPLEEAPDIATEVPSEEKSKEEVTDNVAIQADQLCKSLIALLAGEQLKVSQQEEAAEITIAEPLPENVVEKVTEDIVIKADQICKILSALLVLEQSISAQDKEPDLIDMEFEKEMSAQVQTQEVELGVGEVKLLDISFEIVRCPLAVVKRLSDSSFLENEIGVLECEVSQPDVKVVWTRNEKLVLSSERIEMKSEGRKHSLLIKSCCISDADVYAVNVEEGVTSTATLTILGQYFFKNYSLFKVFQLYKFINLRKSDFSILHLTLTN